MMEMSYISKRFVIGGTLLIWAIKFIIRPAQLVSPPFDFVLGIAPNLLGSFLLPFGAIWLGESRYIRLSRFMQVHTHSGLRQYCYIMFALLVINEYLQKIPIFGRTFDHFDILFSVTGLLLSYMLISKWLQRLPA
jgi:hypothetical protein